MKVNLVVKAQKKIWT